MKQSARKNVISLFLVLVLLCPSSLAAPALAAENQTKQDVFTLSYSEEFPQALCLDRNGLTLYGIPKTEAFSRIWFTIKNDLGKEVYSKIIARDSYGRALASFRLPAGEYTLSLFQGAKAQGSFVVFVDNVQIRWDGSGGVFLYPPVLTANLERSTERNDSTALSFYLKPSPDVQSDHEEIIRMAATITTGLDGDYEKTLAIHDWVSENIYYDYDAYYKRTPYDSQSALDVLHSRKSVCAGYANLTAALLRAAGVPAKTISEYALGIGSDGTGVFPQEVLNGEAEANHSWVMAHADGRWITMDPTWDSGNKWEHGEISENMGCYRHKFFDIALELFSVDHALIQRNSYQELYLYSGYNQYYNGSKWKGFGSENAVPTVSNGITMVPIEAIAAEIGGNPLWGTSSTSGRRELWWVKGTYSVQFWVDYPIFYANGVECRFDIPPRIKHGVVMVQLRPILEAMGCQVRWDAHADGWNGRITVSYTG